MVSPLVAFACPSTVATKVCRAYTNSKSMSSEFSKHSVGQLGSRKRGPMKERRSRSSSSSKPAYGDHEWCATFIVVVLEYRLQFASKHFLQGKRIGFVNGLDVWHKSYLRRQLLSRHHLKVSHATCLALNDLFESRRSHDHSTVVGLINIYFRRRATLMTMRARGL